MVHLSIAARLLIEERFPIHEEKDVIRCDPPIVILTRIFIRISYDSTKYSENEFPIVIVED